jgi:hypothetical protein
MANPLRARMSGVLLLALAALAGTAACSPGALPGTPSQITVGGGGGRYNGTITYRRLNGNYTVSETSQVLTLSVVLRNGAEITGRFDSGQSSGTIAGVLEGNLADGTFQATMLVSSDVTQGGTALSCEGRGEITATLSGVTLSWNGGTISYDDCPGLATTSQAQATAVSPIPGPPGDSASVVVAILPGPAIARGTCDGGGSGFPFTVQLLETAGLSLTFDSTFEVEERRNFGALTSTRIDMPFTDMPAGGRRTYSACSPTPGTYQAFFSGRDVNGNLVRTSSPVVTMGP